MQRVTLSGTDIEVSRLGLGTVKFGRNTGVKYPEGFELPSDKEIHALLDVALACGIQFLDTAPAYGISEERLGKVLTERSPDEPWVIGTKAGEEYDGLESTYDFRGEWIRQAWIEV